MRPVQAWVAVRVPALWKARSAPGESLSAMRTFLARPMRNQVRPRETSSGLRRKRRWVVGEGGWMAVGEVAGVAAELGHHLLVVEDGAGDEVGEEGDEEEVREEVLALGLALREVDEVGDLGEGEEGDAEREEDRVGMDVDEVEGEE